MNFEVMGTVSAIGAFMAIIVLLGTYAKKHPDILK